MNNSLKGKTVIVTGASRGIGEASAYRFAERGAQVILVSRTTDALESIAATIRSNGGAAMAVSADVSQYADWQSLLDQVMGQYKRIDVLVNNAGLIDPITRLEDSDPDAWVRVADVNYKGVYFGLRSVLPVMREQANRGESPAGTIINLSSGAATGALEGWSHYCSSKAAALSLTRCAHKEVGEAGIRVVGLSPGTVATEMQVQIKASGINPVSQLDPGAHIPPEWVAQAIVYLAEDGADDFLGEDFSIKTNEGRQRVGLPAIGESM